MTAPVRFPRFFVTNPAPCPYLPGKYERKVFTELKGEHADALNDALSRIGFRRSQTVAYRPSCFDCNACTSVRIVANEFSPSSSQRRCARRNQDLVVSICRPWSTNEQFSLLQRYLAARHPDGGMTAMDEVDFADMVEHTPVTSYVIEYREPATRENEQGRLVGACLTDRQGDGLSMIYSFYDPSHPTRRGLGNYIILNHIRQAQEMDLPFVYLGYWVKDSPHMEYKARYRPLERLSRNGWERFTPEEHHRLFAEMARPAHNSAAPAGQSKDGGLLHHISKKT